MPCGRLFSSTSGRPVFSSSLQPIPESTSNAAIGRQVRHPDVQGEVDNLGDRLDRARFAQLVAANNPREFQWISTTGRHLVALPGLEAHQQDLIGAQERQTIAQAGMKLPRAFQPAGGDVPEACLGSRGERESLVVWADGEAGVVGKRPWGTSSKRRSRPVRRSQMPTRQSIDSAATSALSGE